MVARSYRLIVKRRFQSAPLYSAKIEKRTNEPLDKKLSIRRLACIESTARVGIMVLIDWHETSGSDGRSQSVPTDDRKLRPGKCD